uniref:Uncharacterized protein n=1 Tax=viral metagenome TaxID=1070528 RepID=A0A6C0I192_9ZZZZ
MEQLFTKAITDKLPTIKHYKQLCYSLSVRRKTIHPYDDFNISVIDTIITIEDIQIYMFNILNENVLRHRGVILSEIDYYLKKFKFYIAPNTYINTLTLKEFFHCIDIKYNGGYYIDTCTYKYNIFYKGEKFDDVHDYHNYEIINRCFISCYYIGVTEGKDDNDFKNLPIEHFTTLLKIMGKLYADGHASYSNDYIIKYWEDKDIELYLEYVIKNRHCLESCLEKNIQKNNYTQKKLLPLYEKYLKYDNLIVQTDPLCYCYTNITKILKKYINFPIVRLGFDTKDIQTITPTIIPDAESESEIIDKIVCIIPHKIQQNLIRSYIISDFIILESGKIIFRTKVREDPYIDGKYVEFITNNYRVYECDPNLFNKQVCINMFSNRYTDKDLYSAGNKIDMVLYYDKELPPYIKIDFNVESYNKILPNKSNADFMTTFINAENNKTHIYRLYIMSKTITKFLALKHTNAELEEANLALQETNAKLQETNAKLRERTKILDESNF